MAASRCVLAFCFFISKRRTCQAAQQLRSRAEEPVWPGRWNLLRLSSKASWPAVTKLLPFPCLLVCLLPGSAADSIHRVLPQFTF